MNLLFVPSWLWVLIFKMFCFRNSLKTIFRYVNVWSCHHSFLSHIHSAKSQILFHLYCANYRLVCSVCCEKACPVLKFRNVQAFCRIVENKKDESPNQTFCDMSSIRIFSITPRILSPEVLKVSRDKVDEDLWLSLKSFLEENRLILE